jgi:hypothetical protein
LLSNDLDCSVSEVSEDSELLSHAREPRTGKLWDVRNMGLPFLPRPSLEGLPGAPSGSLSLYFLGTTSRQFSQTSGSESKELLGRRLLKVLSDAGKLGKYGLWVGERGLVGGVSKGESWGTRPSFNAAGWSYKPLQKGRRGSSVGGVVHGLQALQGEVDAWVQMMEVGPWTSQKCASEIWASR